MRILALCGSLRPESATLKAMRVALKGAEEAGATCDLLEAEAMDLPLYREMEVEPLPAPVERLITFAERADGFLLGSPEYHGGYSGVLKNALDWLSAKELGGKPVALVAVAGGAMGAMSTLNGLRICARNVNAWVLPQQVSIGASSGAFRKDGRPRDQKLEDRLLALGRHLVACSRLFPQLR